MAWTLRDRVTWTPTEYGGVMLDAEAGEYWTLNPTAAEVLSSLLAGEDLPGTVRRVAERFAADPGTVAADVPVLVAELCEAGLVVRP